MCRVVRSVVTVLMWMAVIPTPAYAQTSTLASIAGVVKDTSGAVLPGVTVEAASPVLIEKVRSAVTGGTGEYKIVNLPAGAYTVTFTLTGFSTMRREGIELTGSFTATVNADLKVGAVSETITVTSEAPIVDVQSSQRQQTVSNDFISAVPVARVYTALMNLVPGTSTTGVQDVGGQNGPLVTTFTIHGGRTNEGRVELGGMGVGSQLNGGGTSLYVPDLGNAQEVTFTTSGGLGEADMGGPIMNIVPKQGGNALRGTIFVNGAGSAMVGNNYTPELGAAGLAASNKLTSIWDVNLGLGGPVVKDRLWFYGGERYQGNRKLISNMFVNGNCTLDACNPNLYAFAPDLSRQAEDDGTWHSHNLRLTWQATSKQKVQAFVDMQTYCASCIGLNGGTATTAPESKAVSDAKPQWVQSLSWTAPFTNHLLVDASVWYYHSLWGGHERLPNATEDLVRMSEICAPSCASNGGLGPVTYRSLNWAINYGRSHRWQTSATYVTGAHNVKFGYQGEWLRAQLGSYTNTRDLLFTVNNGVPTQLTELANPFTQLTISQHAGFYVQDQWTVRRLTLSGAVRYDHSSSSFPQQQVGPAPFVPTAIVFPEQIGVVGYNDITPRVSVVYDVFGTGRTAVKLTVSKYLESVSNSGNYTGSNPLSLIATSTTRSWSDLNRDYVPDCDLLNPARNNECGPITNSAFGTPRVNAAYDPALLSGWGVKPSNWDTGVSLQQQVFTRASLEVGYFRRNFRGFTVTNNLAVAASGSFTPFSVTAPTDPRLPGGGGYTVAGLYNVIPSLFGQVNNLVTDASNYGGSDAESYHSNAIDVILNVRGRRGLTFQGGLSDVFTVLDFCGVRAQAPGASVSAGALAVNPWCHAESGHRPDFRGLVSYAVPKVDVQVSATFQSNPGAGSTPAFGAAPGLAANYTVSSAVVQQTLGRPLSGSAANVTVNVLEPGALYGDRINQVDLRVAKIVKFGGGKRLNVGLDIYNVLNANPITTYNQTYGTAWLAPRGILAARFAKFTAQFDF